MSHMSPFRMNVPNMGPDIPPSVSNPKKRKKNNQAPIQTAPIVQDLLPPPLSGYGDTIVASNPFDDCPSTMSHSLSMVRNPGNMVMSGPMPGPPSGMPHGVNSMNMCRPMGPSMGMGSPLMHSPNAHQNSPHPMMNNPMMMNGPRMNHMGGPGPGGPGSGGHINHGHGPPAHMMVSPNGPMHSMTGPPMHSPLGNMGPMQGPGAVGGPGNGGPMGSPMGVGVGGPMNGDMNNPLSGPPMGGNGPHNNQGHGPGGMPISTQNGPVGPPPPSMNNNNFMMSPINNIYSKPMPVSAGKVYPADQPMVFNSQNPNAPPIYPCGVCHKEVHDNDQAILCESGCNFWFHRGCTGLTEGAFQLLTAEVYAEWVCDKCLHSKNIPLVKFKP